MAKIKMKNNRAARKRFKITGSGKVKHKHAYMRHNLGKRKSQTKRLLRKKGILSSADVIFVKELLPNL